METLQPNKAEPVFNYPAKHPDHPGMYLCLFSNNDEDPELTTHGPCIGPLVYAHTVYARNIHLQFVNPSDARLFGVEENDMIRINDDGMFEWNGKLFSDWTVATFPIL